MILLAIVSGNAAAKWIAVGFDNDATTYADQNTIRKKGNRVKMWSVIDFKTAQSFDVIPPFMSTEAQYEFDCQEEQSRTLTVFFHSGNMGGGAAIANDPDPNEWKSIPPGSAVEKLWKFACKKR